MKPKFIALEGGEGSGKSTLTNHLREIVGDTAILTREPGGTPYAEKIRELTLKEPLAKNTPGEATLCLMFAARFEHISQLIAPTLQKGKHVVSDRFDGSSFAYNVWAQSDGTLESLFWNLREALTVKPDLYIYVDVDPSTGYRRAQGRNTSGGKAASYDHFDDRKIEFHSKVREGYLKFLKKVPHVIIDANLPLAEVKENFAKEIKKQLGL